MRIESCYFDQSGKGEFARMARVLEATLAVHGRAWQTSVVTMPSARRGHGTGVPGHIANTHKLDRWCEIVASAPEGEELLLLDADTFVTRPIDDIWAEPFDLAYATKRHGFKFNLGVLFVRVTDRTRAFFEAWRAENAALFVPTDPPVLRKWRETYGGINQAAFGQLEARGALDRLHRKPLSCVEWNCEESAWARFDPTITRIVHVKGALRRQIFNREPVTPDTAGLVNRWRTLETRLLHEARSA